MGSDGILKIGAEQSNIVDTLSFQSPAFYEKHGYIRIGTVDDYRGGVQQIFMQKRFFAESSPSARLP